MKILFLSKRQYLGKDLLDDRYWRYYEMSMSMFNKGHAVTGICLSYRRRNQGCIISSNDNQASLYWYSVNLGLFVLPGLVKYVISIRDFIRNSKPDVVFVGSDIYQVIIGSWLAKTYSIPYIVDMYDNYESFGASRLPAIRRIFRRSVKHANGISCISDSLSRYVNAVYKPDGKVVTIENGIPEGLFKSMDKSAAREKFGIPPDASVIGTVGALSKSRGIDVLFKAFESMRKDGDDVLLLLAGIKDDGLDIPDDTNVIYLGEIPYLDVPALLNTLDVGVICNIDSDFGRYCFPQKAYEMIASNIPIVASNIGSMQELLESYPDNLFDVCDYKQLKIKVKDQLAGPLVIDINVKTWDQLVDDVLSLMRVITEEAAYKENRIN